MQLRPYQLKALDDLRESYRTGHRAPLLVAPTGAGKTIMFSAVAHGRIQRGGRPMILCHRQELIDQIVSSLKRFGIEPGVIAAGYETNYAAPVQVASVFTLARRLESVPSPDLIIVDEAHHAVSKTTWGKILTHYNCLRLGVTATPYRLSGEGLNDLFDDMVLGPSVQELIDLGALSAVKTYAPAEPNTKGLRQTGGDFEKDALAELMDKPSVTGDAVTHYQRLCNGLPAIAFCVSIEHARHVAECFAAAGYRAASVDGKMDREQRKQAIKDFRDGKIQILASCELISEGFDVPGVVAGLLLRPTKSLSLHFQQVGRCLRPADGKERAIILDHAGNTRRFGLVTEPQEWTLASRERKPGRVKSGDESVSVRVCKSCFAATSSRGTVCPDCGTEFPIQQRKVAQRDGELHEVVAGQRRERKREQAGAFSYEDLVNIGRIRGYANPHAWAHHVMKARQKKKSVWSIR